MNSEIHHRIKRIYSSIDAIEEYDPNKLKATVIKNDNFESISQNFRGGINDDELSNQVHTVIHNIANLRDHLRQWAKRYGYDKTKVKQTFDNSFELQVVQDLSNNDKHGYPPRNNGNSKKAPKLIKINCIMQLQTQAKKGSMIVMTLGKKGIPEFSGDGTAKAVVTGDVIDNNGKLIGDLYDIAIKAVETWEQLLANFGLNTGTKNA